MKKPAKRWLVRITCLLLIVTFGAVFLLPPMPLIIAGYFRGEAFFDGKPTSYWRMELQKKLHPSPTTWMENLLARFGYQRSPPEMIAGPSCAAAAPVLLEQILKDLYPSRYRQWQRIRR